MRAHAHREADLKEDGLAQRQEVAEVGREDLLDIGLSKDGVPNWRAMHERSECAGDVPRIASRRGCRMSCARV